MDITTVIASIASVLAIGGTLFAALRSVFKHQTSLIIKDYLSELKPNHGTSLNDKIVLEVLPLLHKLDSRQDQISEDVTDVKVQIAKLEGRFEQHIDDGL